MQITETEFNNLLVAHIPYIKKRAYKHFPTDRARREELVQIAALYVLERRAQFDPKKGKFGTWLLWQLMGAFAGSERRSARKRARHETTMPLTDKGQPAIDVATVDDPSDRLDLEHTLSTMLLLKDGALLYEVAVDGRPERDIARERGVSAQAINQALIRARHRLTVALTNPRALKPADLANHPQRKPVFREAAPTRRPVPSVWLRSTNALTNAYALFELSGARMAQTVQAPLSYAGA